MVTPIVRTFQLTRVPVDEQKKTLGVYFIAGGVISGNILLLAILYWFPAPAGSFVAAKIVPFIAMAAVYPFYFFQDYLREEWPAHFYWMLIIVLSAVGLTSFQRFARYVFIFFNIVSIVTLAIIVVMKYGSAMFLDYFFKLYFSVVASAVYVGFLTLPEVRLEFERRSQKQDPGLWLWQKLHKTLTPHDAAGYYNLGLAYRRLERYPEAVEYLQKAIRTVPDEAEYYAELGVTYFIQKDFSAAIRSFKEAVRLDPVHRKARYHLGLAYREAGCDQEAIAALERSSYLDPKQVDVYRHLGQAYFSAGRFEEAQKAFQMVVALNPADAAAYYHLGLLFLKKDDQLKQAEEVLKKAVRLKPDDADAHFQLGMVYGKMGRHRDAVRSFKEVLRSDENHRQAHYQLGFSYAILKDFDSARREYRYLQAADVDLAKTLLLLMQ